jgi:CBS domain containing-hemolysin-like protein
MFMIKVVCSIESIHKRTVGSVALNIPPVVDASSDMLQLLGTLKAGQHLALVSRDPKGTKCCLIDRRRFRGDCKVIGIITLEDVIERIIQQDIIDETDKVSSDKRYSGNCFFRLCA